VRIAGFYHRQRTGPDVESCADMDFAEQGSAGSERPPDVGTAVQTWSVRTSVNKDLGPSDDGDSLMARNMHYSVDDLSKSARVIVSRKAREYDIEVDRPSLRACIEYRQNNRPTQFLLDHLCPAWMDCRP